MYVKRAEPRKCRKARGSDVAKRGRFRAGPSQLSRTMSLRVMAREYVWLWDYRHGLNAQAIAIRDGVKVQRVEFGIARARAQDKPGDSSTALRPPRLIPFSRLDRTRPYPPAATIGRLNRVPFFAAWFATVPEWTTIRRSNATRLQNPLQSPSPLRSPRRQHAKRENNAVREHSPPLPEAWIRRRGTCLRVQITSMNRLSTPTG